MNLPTPVTNANASDFIGESKAMQTVRQQIAKVAPTKATVLITGETGVGKDVIAEAIYKSSGRKNRPFESVNCGRFEGGTLESELFGHDRGAFSDAIRDHRGRFEQAHGGTLFLNEVGEMSHKAQVNFLSVLDNNPFKRLGGEKNIKVDVRVIAATNIDLATSVRQKKFRQDLYYRLNLFRIHIPPLRDRREDIPLFVSAFASELGAEHRKPITGITQEAFDYLQNADWPGNVRELRSSIERAVILSTTDVLQLKDFPPDPESEQMIPPPVEGSALQSAPTKIIRLDELKSWSSGVSASDDETQGTSSRIDTEICGLLGNFIRIAGEFSLRPEINTTSRDLLTELTTVVSKSVGYLQTDTEPRASSGIQSFAELPETQPAPPQQTRQETPERADWQGHLCRLQDAIAEHFEVEDIDEIQTFVKDRVKAYKDPIEVPSQRISAFQAALKAYTQSPSGAAEMEKGEIKEAVNDQNAWRLVLQAHKYGTRKSDTQKMDWYRSFITFVALIARKTTINKLRQNRYYYKTREGSLCPFQAHGSLERIYEQVLSCMLTNFEKDGNIGLKEKLAAEARAQAARPEKERDVKDPREIETIAARFSKTAVVQLRVLCEHFQDIAENRDSQRESGD